MASKFHIETGRNDWSKQEQKRALKPSGRSIADDPQYDFIQHKDRLPFELGGEKWEAVINVDGTIDVDMASHTAPVMRGFTPLEFAGWLDYMKVLLPDEPAPETEPTQEPVKEEKSKIIPLLPKLDKIESLYERQWVAAQIEAGIIWKSGHECMKALTPHAEAQAA